MGSEGVADLVSDENNKQVMLTAAVRLSRGRSILLAEPEGFHTAAHI